MTDSLLRQKLDRKEFFLAPGLHDMMAAVIARDMKFDIVYGSGFWLTASCFGLPDAGIATFTQMLDRMATLKKTVGGAELIADADTGYGGLLNVHHTVKGYERAGVTAIQIEDQEFPKKCGHTPFKRVIPREDMVAKIRVACEARQDARKTLIIARTDSRAGEGLDAAIRRVEAYGRAGADVLFVEALQSQEEMYQVCRESEKPTMANMADGGKTPILSAVELEQIGYAGAIFPASTALAANAAVERVLRTLKERGTSIAPETVELYGFERFCRQIGFEEVWEFERRWGENPAAPK